MCGIAGYFGLKELSEQRVEACLALMGRRGPDAQGARRFRNRSGRFVCLLHSRLSIIDLDPRANQPFQAGTGHLVLNGEIYNYRELRAKLAAKKSLRTSSDTEVLAELLGEEDWEALRDCEGMWAFAYYDEAAGSLLLSRDRFGEKPLYVYEADGDLYFGSEIKYIVALVGHRLPVNRAHLRRYLVNGYKSLYKGNNTFFKGVTELSAGTVAEIDGFGRRIDHPYWEPTIGRIEHDMSYDEAVEGVRKALLNSVELRLRADVPIAFCLSGGVDSNALIALAKRKLGYDVHGFTIVNTDTRYDEWDMVDASVKSLGLRHTTVPIDPANFLGHLRELVRQHDAPVYTITYYAHWRLMEAIKQAGYKVSISGTGADELFSGYYDHHNAYLSEMRRFPGEYAEADANWRREIEPYVRNPYLKDAEYFVRTPNCRDHIYLDAAEFAEFLTEPFSELFQEENYSGDILRNRMANELFHESVPPILHEDDLNAMYFSIENRSPFLDRALFEWCQSIPTRHLIRNGRAKAVLRDAVRGIAPDAVIDNPRKVGFNAPIFDYLDIDDPGVAEQLLESSPIFDEVRRPRIEAFLKRRELPNSASKFLFYFVSAKMFLEECGS